jgi:ribosomal protein L11 methyltransferase
VGEWAEIVVPVGAADIEDVAALIADEVPAAGAGTEQRGDEVVFWVPIGEVAAALTSTRDAVTRWAANGAALDPARVRSAAAIAEAEWHSWKKYFTSTRLTRQFVVVPSWDQYTPQADDIIIDLDPGMAFGTGKHASTRLVLEHIQVIADAGTSFHRILDVGCGSGILSIAAVKRWPEATVVALDRDPIAVQAAAENALRNKVADRIDSSTTPVSELIEAFPLVLANIQAHVLRDLKTTLVQRTSGTLILSGLLTAQAQPLADEFVAAGMKLVRVRASTDDPQWSSVVLEK